MFLDERDWVTPGSKVGGVSVELIGMVADAMCMGGEGGTFS